MKENQCQNKKNNHFLSVFTKKIKVVKKSRKIKANPNGVLKKGRKIKANPNGVLRFCFKNEGIEWDIRKKSKQRSKRKVFKKCLFKQN